MKPSNKFKSSFVTVDASLLLKAINVKDNIIALSPSFVEDKLFSIYDKEGNLIKKGGEYPWKFGDDYNFAALAFSAMDIVANEDESKFVVAYECMDLLEIYSSDGTLLKQIFGKDKIVPIVEKIENGSTVSVKKIAGRSRAAFFRCVAKDNKIWVSYSGDFVQKEGFSISYIHCYDWNGNLLNIYKTDISILSFDVDCQGNYIYVIDANDINNLYKYQT